jgi:acetate---CoA ligase (ADP-forming)
MIEQVLPSPSLMLHDELDFLFKPKSIAVIGASAKELSIGNVIIKNLVSYGYTGAIYPVNPKAHEIRGLKTYPSLFDIFEDIDLAHVIVPAPMVPQVIEDCGEKGVKAVIINSAGFSEMGEKGMELQAEFLSTAKKYGIRIFGPNCQGIINTDPAFKAYCDFTFTFPEPGPVSIVALSGGVGAFIMQSIFDLGIGMRMYASNGNACDVSVAEVLSYYGDDEGTKAIILYTEGLSDPLGFMQAANSVTKKKPVLAMKAGRTEEGANAAASHTGCLAGVDISTELIFEKTGIISFKNEEEMCQAAMAFSSQPIPKGNRVGVITNTGGPAVIATDELISQGLQLPFLSEKAIALLKETLLPEATIGNPIDVVATGAAMHFRSALDVLLNEETIDSIYINFVTAPFTDTDDVARQIAEVNAMKKKPLVCNFMTNLSLDRFKQTARILKDGKVPCFSFPSNAAKALGALHRYGRIQQKAAGSTKIFIDVSNKKVEDILTRAKESFKEFLAADDVYEILSAYGINSAEWKLCDNPYDALKAAADIRFPVVIKADSPSVVHKSESGGVAVNIKTHGEAKLVLEEMLRKFKDPELRFLVQKYLPGGREFIAGISARPGLGHLVMFGLGGIYVEVMKDVVFKIAPVSDTEAKEMLSSLRCAALLDGVRGEKGLDKNVLVEMIQRLSQLVTDFPQIKEIDLNPVMAFEHSAVVVDARIKI